MDVVTAFLNPTTDNNEIYVCAWQCQRGSTKWYWMQNYQRNQLYGFENALYGSKQAPRLCCEEIDSFLKSIDFAQSTSDPNLYVKSSVLLLLYVNDLLIAHPRVITGSAEEKSNNNYGRDIK